MRSTRPVVVGLLATLLLTSAAGLAACAKTPGSSDLVDALRTSGISKDQAECVVDEVDGILDADDIESLVERGSSGAPRDDTDRTDDKADQLRDAMAECRQLPGATTSTTTTVTVPIDDGTTAPTIRGGLPSESTTTTTTVPADDGASIETTAPD